MTKISILENILIVSIVFIAAFLCNVYAHEFGHYIAADMFDLHPNITVNPINEGLSFSLESKALAYTEFDKTENNAKLVLIALAGPLVNLLITLIFLLIYINYKHNYFIQNVAIAGIMPSIFSFLLNILPYATTDGMMILNSII